MVALVNGTVRLVVVQISCTNPKVIPASVKRLPRETEEECLGRKRRSSGVMVIAPTDHASLQDFLRELEEAGYELVDAFCQERVRSYMVRFLFVRSEFATISDEFKKIRDIIRADIRNLCENALWRVRAYFNPYYCHGEEVPGQYAVSINLEARQPLFRPDGQPVVMWQKDRSGQHVGVAPIPPRADYCLRIVGDAVELVAA